MTTKERGRQVGRTKSLAKTTNVGLRQTKPALNRFHDSGIKSRKVCYEMASLIMCSKI